MGSFFAGQFYILPIGLSTARNEINVNLHINHIARTDLTFYLPTGSAVQTAQCRVEDAGIRRGISIFTALLMRELICD
jgi:hypothetical protein